MLDKVVAVCFLCTEAPCLFDHTVQVLLLSEPGICRGNEDSRGNENKKSRKKFFSAEKQIDKHTFFFKTVRRCSRKYGNHAVNECEFASEIEH